MSTPESFMKEAVNLSLDAVRRKTGGPFGAVVVKDGRIVGRGQNMVTSANDPTAHAEITAIRDACRTLGDFSLHGCDLYASCEPCPMCLAAIYWSGIDRVVYAASTEDAEAAGFDDALIYRELARPPEKRRLPMVRLDDPSARDAFREWIAMEDKIRY